MPGAPPAHAEVHAASSRPVQAAASQPESTQVAMQLVMRMHTCKAALHEPGKVQHLCPKDGALIAQDVELEVARARVQGRLPERFQQSHQAIVVVEVGQVGQVEVPVRRGSVVVHPGIAKRLLRPVCPRVVGWYKSAVWHPAHWTTCGRPKLLTLAVMPAATRPAAHQTEKTSVQTQHGVQRRHNTQGSAPGAHVRQSVVVEAVRGSEHMPGPHQRARAAGIYELADRGEGVLLRRQHAPHFRNPRHNDAPALVSASRAPAESGAEQQKRTPRRGEELISESRTLASGTRARRSVRASTSGGGSCATSTPSAPRPERPAPLPNKQEQARAPDLDPRIVHGGPGRPRQHRHRHRHRRHRQPGPQRRVRHGPPACGRGLVRVPGPAPPARQWRTRQQRAAQRAPGEFGLLTKEWGGARLVGPTGGACQLAAATESWRRSRSSAQRRRLGGSAKERGGARPSGPTGGACQLGAASRRRRRRGRSRSG